MENGIPKNIPAQIGIPIKIVDKTSTPKKIAKLKILNHKKIVPAPAVGTSQSTPPGVFDDNLAITFRISPSKCMFLSRNVENCQLIIIKNPPYLVH